MTDDPTREATALLQDLIRNACVNDGRPESGEERRSSDLLTGYLDGAVATHVRAQEPLFNVIFPVFFGTLLWGALWLRDSRVAKLIPLRGR